jgi:hypothetical protein
MQNLQPKNDNPVPTTASAHLARELRRSLDALYATVDEANEHVCTVEDAHGLEFGAGEVPDAEEQSRGRAGLEAALFALANDENAIRRQLWLLVKARRSLARILRNERNVE